MQMHTSSPVAIPRGSNFNGGPFNVHATSPPPLSSSIASQRQHFHKHSRSISSAHLGTGAMSWTEIAFDFVSRSPLNSSLHAPIGSPQHSTSYTFSPGSFGDTEHIPRLEKNFFKDFTCCGRDLGDFHELLTHFEETHVVVVGPDGRPLLLPHTHSSSPTSIDSPLGPTTPPLINESNDNIQHTHPLHQQLQQHALQYAIAQAQAQTNSTAAYVPAYPLTQQQPLEYDVPSAYTNAHAGVGKGLGFAHAYGFPQIAASPPQSAFSMTSVIPLSTLHGAQPSQPQSPMEGVTLHSHHHHGIMQDEEEDVMMDFDPLDSEADTHSHSHVSPMVSSATATPSPTCASPSLLMSLPPSSLGGSQVPICIPPSLITAPSLFRSKSTSRPHSRATTPTPSHSPILSTPTYPSPSSSTLSVPMGTISNPNTTLVTNQGVEQARAAALAELSSRPISTSPSRNARSAKSRLVYTTSSSGAGSGSEVEGPNPVSRKREKAHKCPVPGCTKSYLNPNGLKYHLSKGTCSFEAFDASHSSASSQMRPVSPLS